MLASASCERSQTDVILYDWVALDCEDLTKGERVRWKLLRAEGEWVRAATSPSGCSSLSLSSTSPRRRHLPPSPRPPSSSLPRPTLPTMASYHANMILSLLPTVTVVASHSS